MALYQPRLGLGREPSHHLLLKLMKTFLHFLLRVLFGLRGHGMDSIPKRGPVLMVPNHVSWLDWLFLAVLIEDDWKFVVSGAVAETSWFHRLVMRNRRTFLIDPGSPYGLRQMAAYLREGGRLVLFAEGRISDTGCLMKLYDGVGFLLAKTPAQLVTACCRGAERLMCSRNPGKRFWLSPVEVHFSPAGVPERIAGVSMARQRAQLTAWVREKMVRLQFETESAFGAVTLPEAIAKTARQRPQDRILEDYRLQPLNYRGLWVGAEVLAERLECSLKSESGPVGVLLPNANVTPLVILALWLSGRTPAVLNYSSGMAAVGSCVRLSGTRTVVTSREFLTKARLETRGLEQEGVRMIFVEDLRAQVTVLVRWRAVLRFSIGWMKKPPISVDGESPAVVLFTSGSEGVPKGVPLTHRNVLANIRQMLAVTDIHDRDRIFTALPLFHSFGLTVGLLLGLVRGTPVFLYPSPLHYRIIPSAVYESNATVFLSTNTFLGGYARRANPYDFRSIRYLFAAAEKVQQSTFETWSRVFGVRVLEGYGATECAPALSVNVPLSMRWGSAGRMLPGVEWRLEPVEGIEEGGRLWVRGPNVMGGYLAGSSPSGPGISEEGWYDTGDLARVDEEGFVQILGRMKRFAKISGEMVSLTAVEDALSGAFPRLGPALLVAVLARPDPGKGEVLIAVSNASGLTREEVRVVLKEKGFSNLCVPAEICFVDRMPLLGTGKIHYRELQQRLVSGELGRSTSIL